MRIAPSAHDHLRHLDAIVQNRNANPNPNPNPTNNPNPNPTNNLTPDANLDS